MNNYMKVYIVFGACLVILMGLLYQSVLGQKAISPEQLTTEQAVKDTFLTKIISKSVDIDKGILVFEYNCIFDNCFIGQDLTQNINKETGREIKGIPSYSYETIESVNIPSETIIPKICNVNGTDYNCDEIIKGSETIEKSVWVPIKSETIVSQGIYKIKVIVSWEAGTGAQSVDWVPVIDLKQSRYPEIAKDLRAEKTEWAWFNSSWYNCRNISIGSGNNSVIFNALVYGLNLTNLTFDNVNQIRIVNSSCNEGGTSSHYQVWDSGPDWADIAFQLDLNNNVTWSVYYNNTNASIVSPWTDPVFSRPDLFIFNFTCINKYASSNILATTKIDHIEFYHTAGAGGANIACTYDNNATTRGTPFNTDTLNTFYYKGYTNTSNKGDSRGCPLSDGCDTSVVAYFPSWTDFNAVNVWSKNWTNTSTFIAADFDRIRLSIQNPNTGDSYLFLYDMLFCDDCNVSDTIEVIEGEQENYVPPVPPIPPGNETNVTIVVNIDTSEALQSETRRVCVDNDTLQVDSFIYRCIGASGDAPYCFWSNTTRYEYCQTGCINDSNQLGGQCAYTEFETTIIGVVVFIVFIGILFWLYRRR